MPYQADLCRCIFESHGSPRDGLRRSQLRLFRRRDDRCSVMVLDDDLTTRRKLLELRALEQMRDRAGSNPASVRQLRDFIGGCAFLPLGKPQGQGRTRARRQRRAAFRLRHRAWRPASTRFSRTDSAQDRNESIGDSGLGGGVLDLARERLACFLAVRPVVDEHRYALLRQPGDLVRRDLAAHHHLSSSWRIMALFPLSVCSGPPAP